MFRAHVTYHVDSIPIVEVTFAIVGFAVRTYASRTLSIALDFLPSTKVTGRNNNKVIRILKVNGNIELCKESHQALLTLTLLLDLSSAAAGLVIGTLY
jgi:hypothetical protein